jgi:hypothetical protein
VRVTRTRDVHYASAAYLALCLQEHYGQWGMFDGKLSLPTPCRRRASRQYASLCIILSCTWAIKTLARRAAVPGVCLPLIALLDLPSFTPVAAIMLSKLVLLSAVAATASAGVVKRQTDTGNSALCDTGIRLLALQEPYAEILVR